MNEFLQNPHFNKSSLVVKLDFLQKIKVATKNDVHNFAFLPAFKLGQFQKHY